MYAIGLLSVCATNILQVFLTRSIGWAIDILSKHQSTSLKFISFLRPGLRADTPWTIFQLFVAVFVGQFLIAFFRALWRLTLARQTHHSAGILKEEIWRNACYYSENLLNRKMSKGALMSACTSDVGSARFLFGFSLVGLSDFLFLTLMSFFTMFIINKHVALYAFFALVPLPFIMRWVSELEAKSYDEAQNKLSDFNDFSSQVVSTLRLQKMTETQEFWRREWYSMAETYRQYRFRSTLFTLRWIPAMGSVSLGCNFILFIIGIQYVYLNKMSIGDFIAMHGLIYLVQEPLHNLGIIISEIRRGFIGLKRLSDVYNAPSEEHLLHPTVPKKDIKSQIVIEAKDLSFKFKDSNHYLFKNFNLKVYKGNRIGIIGPIGTGKTVLLKILAGLLGDYEGEVKIDGQHTWSYEHENFRKKLIMVSQGSFLFAESLRENICLGENFSDLEINKAINLAELNFDIRGMEKGLDTPLGEWGINLSGGQKQRLCLARALIRRPEILFLDDCLSAIDTITEEQILLNLDKELGLTTVIWVAHRASTLKYCNAIINLMDFKADK